jgi:hypothetical protein
MIDAATRPAPSVSALPPASDQRGTQYGLAGLESELGRLATGPRGQRNDTLVRANYRAGQLVAGGQLDAHASLHAVAARIGLDETEIERTVCSGLTSGAPDPRRPAA